MEYLDGLNEQQRLAVLHGAGPAMVLAGAGSGKTKVLTTRVAHLINSENVPPENIVLLTFTNKAAGEMTERVQRLTGYHLPFSGTFHRLCARLLRSHGPKVKLPQEYVIYDSDDQLSLVKLIAKEFGLDPKQYHPRAIMAGISDAKQQLLGPAEYAQFARGTWQETIARVYKVYEHRLEQSGAVDFDNLLVKVVELLRNHPDIRQRYQQQFQHVLIDEYQDTNTAQYVLTKLLAFPQNNLYVVGDASQAIYGWRGADYRNLLKLKNDFANIETYRLEQNYRSTPNILEAASGVIRNNTLHPVLELWTDNNDSQKISVLENLDGAQEASRIVDLIDKLQEEESLGDMAVLYRTNAQSREFEEALLRAGIPYRLVGGVEFYARKEIKDVLALLSLLFSPVSEMARLRLEKRGKRRLADFLGWVEQRRAEEGFLAKPTLELIDAVLQASGYLERLDEKDPEDLTRIENIQELRSVASQLPELATFLEQVALVENDAVGNQKQVDGPAVTLMSLHAAKGLEFNVVFLAGMEEGLFPHSRSLLEKEQMEEERRLCYVGITRARKRLYLSWAKSRLMYGSYKSQLPARFLKEIPERVIERSGSPVRKTVDIEDPDLTAILYDDMAIDEWLRK